jgi:hypothetical protein
MPCRCASERYAAGATQRRGLAKVRLSRENSERDFNFPSREEFMARIGWAVVAAVLLTGTLCPGAALAAGRLHLTISRRRQK